jgi:RND family efflux transporter MFP subunit
MTTTTHDPVTADIIDDLDSPSIIDLPTLLSQHQAQIAGSIGAEHYQKIQALSQTLQSEYHQLQIAYHQSEDDKYRLENNLKKIKRRRKFIVFGLLIVGLSVGWHFWAEELTAYVQQTELVTTAAKKKPIYDNIVVVEQKAFQTKLPLTGKIEPLEQIEVTSRLEGTVKEKFFQYGEFVSKGTLLLVIDTTQEQAKYREAKAKYLEALKEVKKLRNWNNNPEVTKVRHSLTKYQYELETIKREMRETRRLLKKGIVPASELEDWKNKYRNAKLDYQSTKEHLQEVSEKGSRDNLQIAELQMENARFDMQESEKHIKNARVINPIDGVVLLPAPEGQNNKPKEIQRGSLVTADKVLFRIANMEGFTIKAKVDEIDILKLKVGQKAIITGDAFPEFSLEGILDRISSQAEEENMDENASNFPVTIAMSKFTAKQKSRLRLGMSTNIEVVLQENKKALVIPLAAVAMENGKAWVSKLDKKSGEPKKVPVKTGATTIDEVEILEGLAVGDKLVSGVLPADD